jgi:hypothetical protein
MRMVNCVSGLNCHHHQLYKNDHLAIFSKSLTARTISVVFIVLGNPGNTRLAKGRF